MCTIFDLLKELNELSPFVWEIRTDGYNFTLLCEDLDVHDPKSGRYLTDMSPQNCEAWLKKLIAMERGEEE